MKQNMSYVLYSKENCAQCNFTKKFLEDKGIVPHMVDVDNDPQALAELQEENITSVPVLKDANGLIITIGFQPQILKTL